MDTIAKEQELENEFKNDSTNICVNCFIKRKFYPSSNYTKWKYLSEEAKTWNK